MIALGGAWVSYWLAGKPRLIVFSPNSTSFQLAPTQPGGVPFLVHAGQVILQNNGRKSATSIQIVAEPGVLPWGYNLFPTLHHAVKTGARGEWILEIEFLGPGETVTLQILNGPPIATVRALEGPAKAVPVIHQRLYPKWANYLAGILMLSGAVTLGYIIYICIFLVFKVNSHLDCLIFLRIDCV